MTSTPVYGVTQKMAEETLRREHARAQQELDAWTNRTSASRVIHGVESPVTAACDQMVTFWTTLCRTSAAALKNIERPVSTLHLRPEEAT